MAVMEEIVALLCPTSYYSDAHPTPPTPPGPTTSLAPRQLDRGRYRYSTTPPSTLLFLHFGPVRLLLFSAAFVIPGPQDPTYDWTHAAKTPHSPPR